VQGFVVDESTVLEVHTGLAAARRRAEYALSMPRNAIEAAVSAAAVSPATSDPGLLVVTLYAVRRVSMSSGLSQH
jgi:hypothetical protein